MARNQNEKRKQYGQQEIGYGSLVWGLDVNGNKKLVGMDDSAIPALKQSKSTSALDAGIKCDHGHHMKTAITSPVFTSTTQ